MSLVSRGCLSCVNDLNLGFGYGEGSVFGIEVAGVGHGTGDWAGVYNAFAKGGYGDGECSFGVCDGQGVGISALQYNDDMKEQYVKVL